MDINWETITPAFKEGEKYYQVYQKLQTTPIEETKIFALAADVNSNDVLSPSKMFTLEGKSSQCEATLHKQLKALYEYKDLFSKPRSINTFTQFRNNSPASEIRNILESWKDSGKITLFHVEEELLSHQIIIVI